MSNILLLPDEIKLKIFQYLNGIDKIEILRVCEDFHRIGVDRKILEYLDFSYNYKFTIKSHLKCVKYVMVTHLNLNGIYWIPSAELRNSLLRFVNLQSLHVLDTQLSYRDLVTVLNQTNQVRKLAFSLRPDNCGDVYLVNIEMPITHLYVTFYSHQLRCLFRLLGHFSELEELWMIEPRYPNTNIQDNYHIYTDQLQLCKLPKINRRIVISQRRHLNIRLINLFHLDCNYWEAVVENTEKHNIFTIFEKRTSTNNIKQKNDGSHIRNLEQFTTINDIRSIRSTENIDNIKLTGLNFDDTGSSLTSINLKSILTESPLTSALKRWRGVSECFWEVKPVEKPPSPLFKKRRVGVSFPKLDDNNLFARFTRHTPQMEDFEIIDKTRDSLHRQLFQIDSLKFMVNWKALKHLTIHSVNMKSGKFMVDVLKSCTELTRLKIRDNSFQDDFSGDLCNALMYATNLRDFCYKRNGSIPIDKLFDSLKCCGKLERIYVQCRCAHVISKSPIETLLTVCENLIYFFLYISELPETVCRSIKQSIQELNLKPQQIVLIKGQTYDMSTIIYNDIPMFHIEDMVCQTNHFYSNFIRNSF